MLNKILRKISIFFWRLTYIPRGYIFILSVMLFAALIIRLSTGGTHIVYNALGNRGIFPGPFLYFVCYIMRVVLFSIVLYFSLYVQRIYGEGLIPLILIVCTAVLLLLEYKMIFGGVSLILEMLFCVLSGFFCILSIILAKVKHPFVSVAALIFSLLQLILFVQIISLSICI